MYRHASYFNCSACGRLLSLSEAEFDEQARYVCTRCHNLRRIDLTLARWRKDARGDRWMKLGAAVAAIAVALFVA